MRGIEYDHETPSEKEEREATVSEVVEEDEETEEPLSEVYDREFPRYGFAKY